MCAEAEGQQKQEGGRGGWLICLLVRSSHLSVHLDGHHQVRWLLLLALLPLVLVLWWRGFHSFSV